MIWQKNEENIQGLSLLQPFVESKIIFAFKLNLIARGGIFSIDSVTFQISMELMDQILEIFCVNVFLLTWSWQEDVQVRPLLQLSALEKACFHHVPSTKTRFLRFVSMVYDFGSV